MRALNACAVAALMTLAACGGGGSGGTGDTAAPAAVTPPPATMNVAAAYLAFFGSPRIYHLTGTISGDTFVTTAITGGINVSSTTQTTVAGKSYNAVTFGFAAINGNQVVQSNDTLLSLPGATGWDYDFFPGACVIVNTNTPLPTSAAANTGGRLVTGSYYGDRGCTAANPTSGYSPSTRTANWSYSANGTFPAVCIEVGSSSGSTAISTTYCIEVTDAAGAIGSRIAVTQTTNDISSHNTSMTTLAN